MTAWVFPGRFLLASLIFLAPLLLLPLAGAARNEAWTPLGLRGETVLALAVAGSSAERVVYAETHTGLWRFTAAEGWQRIDGPLPRTPLGGPALAAWRVVPGRTRVLYAVTGAGTARQLYRSEDSGAAWQLVGPAPGQLDQPPMVVLAGPSGAPDTITLATDSRIQRSSDGGATWSPGGPWPAGAGKADGGLAAATHTVHALLGDSSAPDRLYALGDDVELWLSESGGRAWRVIPRPAGRSDRPATILAIMPYFGIRLWTAAGGELSFSADNGLSWTTQRLPAAPFGGSLGPTARSPIRACPIRSTWRWGKPSIAATITGSHGRTWAPRPANGSRRWRSTAIRAACSMPPPMTAYGCTGSSRQRRPR